MGAGGGLGGSPSWGAYDVNSLMGKEPELGGGGGGGEVLALDSQAYFQAESGLWNTPS